jgi:hypothetical protein
MGERPLWEIFLEEQVTDLSEVILCGGVHGLLVEFESWLTRHDLIGNEQRDLFYKTHNSF